MTAELERKPPNLLPLHRLIGRFLFAHSTSVVLSTQATVILFESSYIVQIVNSFDNVVFASFLLFWSDV